jgi:hypothetical protein
LALGAVVALGARVAVIAKAAQDLMDALALQAGIAGAAIEVLANFEFS